MFLSVALHLTILGYKLHLLPVPRNAALWAREPVQTLVVPEIVP